MNINKCSRHSVFSESLVTRMSELLESLVQNGNVGINAISKKHRYLGLCNLGTTSQTTLISESLRRPWNSGESCLSTRNFLSWKN